MAGTTVHNTGAMIALIPTAADAERLALRGGEPAGELHCTLAYLGDADQFDGRARQDIIDQVSTAVLGMSVVEADGFAVSLFNPGKREKPACITLGLSGDDVDAAHTLVVEAVWTEAPKQLAPWNAHLTLAYTDNLRRFAAALDRVGPIRFDRLRLAFGGQHTDLPLIDVVDEPDEPDADEPGDDLWLTEADGDSRNKLKRYWLHGKGLKRWAGKRHPWTALFKQLRKHLSVERAKRVASSWYREHFGHMPNQKGTKVAESLRALLEAAGADHPDSCATANISSVCYCGCSGTQHGIAVARARLGGVAIGRAEREGRDLRLAGMTDDELAAVFTRSSAAGQWDTVENIAGEMGRRDEERTWPEQNGVDEHWGVPDAEPTEQDRQIDALLARGYDFVDAYAEVHGQDPERLRAQQGSSAVAADRRTGESTDQALRRSYDSWVHEQWLRAETETRGHLLTSEAQAAGIHPVDLFSGPTARARRHASEDLQRWWADNGGRMTFTQYRAQVLGRDRDRRAAELTTVGGNGRDFI